MTGPVIELDRDVVEAPRERSGLPARWWRWVGVATAAVVSGTGLVASTSPSGRLVEVARVDPAPVAMMHVAGSALFAVMRGGEPHLARYRLADGALQWSVPLGATGTVVQIDGQIEVVDGAVVITVNSGLAAVRTVAVDAVSGRELWRSDLPRVFGLDTGDIVVLGTYLNPDGRRGMDVYPGTPTPPLPLLLRAVEARTGRSVWTYQVPADWQTALPVTAADGEPAQAFVVVSPNGQATAVDLATGAGGASTVIDAAAFSQHELGDLPAARALGVYGDQLVLITNGQSRPTLAAYRVTTLTQQWATVLPAKEVSVGPCGPWLCVSYMNGLYGIAAETGTPVWTMTTTTQCRGWLGRWMYVVPDRAHLDAIALLDPVTQRVVLPLGRWRAPTQGSTGPVLMTLVEPQSTWLGLLTGGPRIDILGKVSGGTPDTCQVDDHYLACLTVCPEPTKSCPAVLWAPVGGHQKSLLVAR